MGVIGTIKFIIMGAKEWILEYFEKPVTTTSEPSELEQAEAKIKELEAKLEVAVDALEFYSNDINWNETDPGFSDRIDSTDYNKPHSKFIGYVGGMKARQALEKIRGSNE